MAKSIQDLTIRDSFMFSKVMSDSKLCKELLELILEMKIDRIEVNYEETIKNRSYAHGIRLDVYAKDKTSTRYNVEMQVRSQKLEKRTRYYHDQIDMYLLPPNKDYSKLPNTYVIFICNFDPIEKGGKYRYTIKTVIEEIPTRDYVDGRHTILLSTKGKNADEVPRKLVEFLKYIEKDSPNGSYYSDDAFVKALQKAVNDVKQIEEGGKDYVLLEEMLRNANAKGRHKGRLKGRREGIREGRREGIREGKINFIIHTLLSKGYVTPELKQKITEQITNDNIDSMFSKALQAETIEDFEKELY